MDDRIRAILYQHPARVPVGVSLLPATWLKYGAALNDIRADYPDIFGEVRDRSELAYSIPSSYHAGTFTDGWGCVWSNLNEGYESIVTGRAVRYLSVNEATRPQKA